VDSIGRLGFQANRNLGCSMSGMTRLMMFRQIRIRVSGRFRARATRSRTDELMSHYCRHVYDLKLPPQDSPEYIGLKPCDDEVESFQVSLGCSTRPGAYHPPDLRPFTPAPPRSISHYHPPNRPTRL